MKRHWRKLTALACWKARSQKGKNQKQKKKLMLGWGAVQGLKYHLDPGPLLFWLFLTSFPFCMLVLLSWIAHPLSFMTRKGTTPLKKISVENSDWFDLCPGSTMISSPGSWTYPLVWVLWWAALLEPHRKFWWLKWLPPKGSCVLKRGGCVGPTYVHVYCIWKGKTVGLGEEPYLVHPFPHALWNQLNYRCAGNQASCLALVLPLRSGCNLGLLLPGGKHKGANCFSRFITLLVILYLICSLCCLCLFISGEKLCYQRRHELSYFLGDSLRLGQKGFMFINFPFVISPSKWCINHILMIQIN